MIRSIIKILLKSLPLFVIALVVVQVVISNYLATLGQSLGDIDTKIESLQGTNALLESEVASASSLLTISAKAKERGFIKPTAASFVVLGGALPLALGKSQ